MIMLRDFNFFSIYIDSKRESRKKKLYYSVIFLAFFISATGFYLFNHQRIIRLENKIAKIEAEISSKEYVDGIARYNETKKKLDVLTDYFNTVESVSRKVTYIDVISNDLLEDIEEAFPQKIFIQTFNASHNEIVMQGVSESRTAVAEFQHNLKAINCIEKIHISIIKDESNKTENFLFSVRCTLKDVEKNEN